MQDFDSAIFMRRKKKFDVPTSDKEQTVRHPYRMASKTEWTNMSRLIVAHGQAQMIKWLASCSLRVG